MKQQKRPRGRPPKTESQSVSIREVIVQAAREVCCESGVHNLTVEHILVKSGISRPTFYKFFNNKDEVLDHIQKEVNQSLINSIIRIFTEKVPNEVSLESAIDAYLQWGMEEGAIIGKLYQAMVGGYGILSKNRETTINILINNFQHALAASGLPQRDPLLLRAMVHAVENLCNPLFTGKYSEEYYSRVRAIVVNSFKKLILTD